MGWISTELDPGSVVPADPEGLDPCGESMTPALGTLAPDFELPLVPGEAPLRLSDYRGHKPVVIFFFPLAFSGTCTKEFRILRDDMDEWDALGAALIGISVDSPWANQLFAEQCQVPFPVLSDFNRDAVTAYGIRDDDFLGMKGVGKRSVFVVDRGGMVRYAWIAEDADLLPDFAALKQLVGQLP